MLICICETAHMDETWPARCSCKYNLAPSVEFRWLQPHLDNQDVYNKSVTKLWTKFTNQNYFESWKKEIFLCFCIFLFYSLLSRGTAWRFVLPTARKNLVPSWLVWHIYFFRWLYVDEMCREAALHCMWKLKTSQELYIFSSKCFVYVAICMYASDIFSSN